jgi:protein disulfide-isomerase A6
VVKGSGLYMVEFYAPWCVPRAGPWNVGKGVQKWAIRVTAPPHPFSPPFSPPRRCGHCKNLAPAWKQAAKALKGIVGVVAVDASAAESLARRYGVQGFPTLKLFGENKAEPIEYSGGRDAQAIVNWAMSQAQNAVKARMGGKSGSSSGSSSSGSKGGKGGGSGPNKAPSSEPGGGKHVVTLTSDNFEELVLKSKDAWMVEFYAPWCGHCKSLAADWAEAAEQVSASGGVKFGAVDATQHQDLGSRFGVRGYPTIKTFPGGDKTEASAKDYNGGRSAAELAAAAAKLGEATAPPPSVDQLVSAAQFEEHCTGKRICLVSVLPHILDDGAAGRKARLAALTDAAGKQRGKPYKFLWSEVGAQSALEGAMAVGLVPALFAVAADKKVFTAHRGAFDAAAISAFASSLTTTKGAAGAQPFPASFDLRGSIAKAAPWDGKDGKAAPPAADEISLDDLDM